MELQKRPTPIITLMNEANVLIEKNMPSSARESKESQVR